MKTWRNTVWSLCCGTLISAAGTALMAGKAVAFTLSVGALTDAGEPGNDYIPKVSFQLGGGLAGSTAVVSLKPGMPQKLNGMTVAAQEAYTADKAGQYSGWDYFTANESGLAGTLVIDTYQARRGTASNEGVSNAAGALFEAHYAPHITDPNLTWLQYFNDNTGLGGAYIHHIDPFPNDDGTVTPGKEKLPFYWRDNEDGENLSDPFQDRPHDPITSDPFKRVVNFELYLVSYDPGEVNDGTQGGELTVYGGVAWGYKILVPEPGHAVFALVSLFFFTVTRRRTT